MSPQDRRGRACTSGARQRCSQLGAADRRETADSVRDKAAGPRQNLIHSRRSRRAVDSFTAIYVQLRPRDRRRDARDPKIEQPIEPAQRVRGENCPRRWRLPWHCRAETIEHPVGYGLVPAAGQPIRHRSNVITAGRNQDRAISGEPPQIARLFQVTCRIVEPKETATGFSNKTDNPVAATADVKIASRWNALRQRCPIDPVMAEGDGAAIPRRNLMAAPRQCFGKGSERRLGATERPPLRGLAIKGNAVIGHYHLSHSPP